MINYLLEIPIVISFLVTLLFMPNWIRKAKQIGLMWNDMNKISSKRVAGSGGIVVVLGFVIGLLLFVGYLVFYESENNFLVEIFALLSVILLLAGIGLVDDLLGWQKGGLRRRTRIIFVLVASIPLIAMNAGKSTIGLPLVGFVDLGIIYPLIFIPIGIIGATTTFNFLAGFNGLEAGQGVIMLSSLALVSYLTGSAWLSIIALCMVFSLLAFLLFNFYPAKIFPGDVLTYPVGGLIAIMAILGNYEKIAVFFFIPTIIEVFLKGRGKYVKQSFGKPMKDGSLDLRYEKIYSLNHLAIFLMRKFKIKSTERKVVLSLWTFQIVIILLGFILFRGGIF
ncbi:glycosyl transferase family 4 [Candidatus Pacearchaeota archaeon]|nr:glycosyl transferase family 4 [Candidatus Pacearchaeota archaeon]